MALTLRERGVKLPKLIGLAAAFTSLLAVCSANAATFTLVGGTGSTLQSNFNPSGWSNPFGLTSGSAITIFSSVNAGGGNGLFVSSPVTLTYTYMGTEADYHNIFEAASSVSATALFDNKSGPNAPLTQTYTLSSNPGLVPALFESITPGNKDAINGVSINSAVKLAFAIVNGGSTAFAFFEDIAVGGDGDFDDMVVRIDARDVTGGGPSPTPLPATLPLFAAGAGVIGLLLRRRKRAA